MARFAVRAVLILVCWTWRCGAVGRATLPSTFRDLYLFCRINFSSFICDTYRAGATALPGKDFCARWLALCGRYRATCPPPFPTPPTPYLPLPSTCTTVHSRALFPSAVAAHLISSLLYRSGLLTWRRICFCCLTCSAPPFHAYALLYPAVLRACRCARTLYTGQNGGGITPCAARIVRACNLYLFRATTCGWFLAIRTDADLLS